MGYAGIYKKIKVAVRKPAFYNVLETFYFPEKLHVLNENFLEFSRKKMQLEFVTSVWNSVKRHLVNLQDYENFSPKVVEFMGAKQMSALPLLSIQNAKFLPIK